MSWLQAVGTWDRRQVHTPRSTSQLPCCWVPHRLCLVSQPFFGSISFFWLAIILKTLSEANRNNKR